MCHIRRMPSSTLPSLPLPSCVLASEGLSFCGPIYKARGRGPAAPFWIHFNVQSADLGEAGLKMARRPAQLTAQRQGSTPALSPSVTFINKLPSSPSFQMWWCWVGEKEEEEEAEEETGGKQARRCPVCVRQHQYQVTPSPVTLRGS